MLNHLTPNNPYSRTAPLTSKRCILYIYSTNIGTEYFKHGIYSPVLSSSKCSFFHNSNVFGSYIIHILYTVCAKISKNYSGAKRLIDVVDQWMCFCMNRRWHFMRWTRQAVWTKSSRCAFILYTHFIIYISVNTTTLIPRPTKVIRSGITFVSRNELLEWPDRSCLLLYVSARIH